MIRSCFRSLIVLFSLGMCSLLQAQIPDEFLNLHVLPRGITKPELVETMKSFTRSLGVRCEHCHVGEAGKPLSTFDFASDKKEEKKTARLMMKMVQDINTKYITTVATKGEQVSVQCATCHHGVARPLPLEDLLMQKIADGVEGAVKEYRDLKAKYYGSYSYDFSDKPLNQVGMRLQAQKKPEDAIVFLKLNTEEHPQSLTAHILLSQAYAQSDDKPRALEALEKALSLDPGNEELKKQVEGLKVSVK